MRILKKIVKIYTLDTGSGKNSFRIQKVKKRPDPGSATLTRTKCCGSESGKRICMDPNPSTVVDFV
jgi:hypothetical protein